MSWFNKEKKKTPEEFWQSLSDGEKFHSLEEYIDGIDWTKNHIEEIKRYAIKNVLHIKTNDIYDAFVRYQTEYETAADKYKQYYCVSCQRYTNTPPYVEVWNTGERMCYQCVRLAKARELKMKAFI